MRTRFAPLIAATAVAGSLGLPSPTTDANCTIKRIDATFTIEPPA